MTLLLGAAGAWLVAHFGRELGLLDRPNVRSSHHTPTPKGGGIGILVAFLVTSLLLKMPSVFWLPTSVVAVLGFYGDRKEVSPRLRLVIQFIGAFILLVEIYGGERNIFQSLLVILPASVFIVGTANFYNFMEF